MGCAILGANEHETTAAEIARGRVHHRQGECGRDGSVDSIAAGLHHFHAGAGGQLMDARYHAVIGHFGVHATACEAGPGSGEERERGVNF